MRCGSNLASRIGPFQPVAGNFEVVREALGPAHRADQRVREERPVVFRKLLREREPAVSRRVDGELVAVGGLVLGPRALAPRSIVIAEHLAQQVLGNDWCKVSSHQKRYVLERLSRCSHVTVLDFELCQHDTSRDVPLDVDFIS